MDIHSFIENGKDYLDMYSSYRKKCDLILPLGEKYELLSMANIAGVEFPKGTTFVIDMPIMKDKERIDIVLLIGSRCIIYDDIDELLSDLSRFKFGIFREDVIQRIEFIKDEASRICKMIRFTDVELLMNMKDAFETMKTCAESADYTVTLKEPGK
jgi:hypothetical protein